MNPRVRAVEKNEEYDSGVSSQKDDSSEEKFGEYLIIQTELCKPDIDLKVLISKTLFEMNDWERRNLVLDIVRGLQYIHEQGIMHRDLKPANVLISMDNRAKIGDFGFARKYSSSEQDREAYSKGIGTVLYCAPEVTKTSSYNFKVDYYSLGLIIFEMYCPMEVGRERLRIIYDLRNMKFDDLDKIPAKFKNVSWAVKNLLNHDASLRNSLDWVKDQISPIEHLFNSTIEVIFCHLYQLNTFLPQYKY